MRAGGLKIERLSGYFSVSSRNSNQVHAGEYYLLGAHFMTLIERRKASS
jgi:hypothetical protein